jgi:hypothetical protein
MGMVDRVPQADLENLRGGKLPPGIPLYDSEQIEDLCKRWVSLSQNQRVAILYNAGFRLYENGEHRDDIASELAIKYLTQLSNPIRGWRRMSDEQIHRACDLTKNMPIH